MSTALQEFAFLLLFPVIAISAVADEVRIWEEHITIPTYAVQPADVNPLFYEGRVYQGAMGPVYPYAMMDGLTDEKVDRTYKALYLENEYVRICVLPEIGGRIFEALDKTNGYDFFYRQHVIKPALIGMLGAWISGGVEWNVFHHHRATTFMPVDYKLAENPDGSKTVWVGETERRHRMKWSIGMTLLPRQVLSRSRRSGCSTARPTSQSMLYWANVAVHANDDYQVIFPPGTQFGHVPRQERVHPLAHGARKSSRHRLHGGRRRELVEEPPQRRSPSSPWNPRTISSAATITASSAGVVHVANHHVVPRQEVLRLGHKPGGRSGTRCSPTRRPLCRNDGRRLLRQPARLQLDPALRGKDFHAKLVSDPRHGRRAQRQSVGRH